MTAGGGLFIVFEGVEGAGKSSHARRLSERLDEAGIPCRLVREPGGTEAGERIRRIVLDPALEISAEAELFLILAARAEFVRRVVRPALEAGEVVVADRYELSTFAYQGVGRGLGLETVRGLNRVATGGLRPDAVVLLAVDPEAGLRRKSGEADRMERAGRPFHRRVARAYRELAEDDPDVLVVDSGRPVEAVEADILAALAVRWPETFPFKQGLREQSERGGAGVSPRGGRASRDRSAGSESAPTEDA